MTDRYVVRSTTGWSEATGHGAKPATSYFVADSAYCFRECPMPVRQHDRWPSDTVLLTMNRHIAERACALLLWDEAIDARAGRG